MAANTGVDWAGHSWPVVVGCELESPGCIHCYAIRDAWRMAHHPNPKISGNMPGWSNSVTARTPESWLARIFAQPSRQVAEWPERKRDAVRAALNIAKR